MYGDRFGSTGRDDRQDDTERRRAPWDAGFSPSSADDVKVAGAPISPPSPYGGDGGFDADTTTDLPRRDDGLGSPLGGMGGGMADDAPQLAEREFDDLRRKPRSSTKTIKIAAVAAAVVVLGGGAAGAWAMTGDSGSDGRTGSGPEMKQSQAEAQAPAPLTDAQRKDAEAKRRKELKKRASRAAREDAGKPTLYVKGTPPPTKKPTEPAPAGDPVPAGEAQRIARGMLPSYGWSPSSQFGCLVNLWNRESHWNTHAGNQSGAYGIPQALPGTKMASAGADWRDSAATQIKWGLGYIKGRYSDPCGAWAHSQSTGWY